MINVRAFGARGNGVDDDQPAIQRALVSASGDDPVWLPAGVYKLGRGAGFWNLSPTSPGTRIQGDGPGTVLMQAPDMSPSVRMLNVTVPSVTIENLVLDGNRYRQLSDEHRAAVFAMGAPGLVLRQIKAVGFTGDGVHLHHTSRAVLQDVTCIGNGRNGATLTGQVDDVYVAGGAYRGNAAQQIDSEPDESSAYTVNNVRLDGVALGGAPQELTEVLSNDFVLTCSGSGAASRSNGWVISDCKIAGGVRVAWCDNVTFDGNTGWTNSTTKPCLQVYRLCEQVTVNDCDMAASGPAKAMIEVMATGPAQRPTIDMYACRLMATYPMHGVHVVSARAVRIAGCGLTGFGGRIPVCGVYARSAIAGATIDQIIMVDSKVDGFMYGLRTAAAPGWLGEAVIARSQFSGAAGREMEAAIMCPDPADDVAQFGNEISGACRVLVGAAPQGSTRTDYQGGDRWLAAMPPAEG